MHNRSLGIRNIVKPEVSAHKGLYESRTRWFDHLCYVSDDTPAIRLEALVQS